MTIKVATNIFVCNKNDKVLLHKKPLPDVRRFRFEVKFTDQGRLLVVLAEAELELRVGGELERQRRKN